jgi:hypothetical protein
MFGFGQKQIDVVIEKFNFSPGETVKGRVILKLSKPTHAKALKVGLRGERISTRTTRPPSGTATPHQDKSYIYNFEMPLDGEKDYSEGEYSFEIKIPASLSQNMPLPGGAVGGFLKGLQILANAETRINWYVIAYLDVPMGIDISKKVQVNIG